VRTFVSMDPDGRLTLPEAARSALHVEGAMQFEVEVAGGALILHPIVVTAGDEWAYVPEHLARVERAQHQGRSGQTHTLSEAELDRRATR
jgi:DNA-binding transcriptional regulator/RsmH inhibitor MraZ